MNRLVFAFVLLVAAPMVTASELMPPLEEAGPDGAAIEFTRVGYFVVCNWCYCRFEQGGRLDCSCGGDSQKASGQWEAKGRHMYGTVAGRCKFHFEIIAVSDYYFQFYEHKDDKAILTHLHCDKDNEDGGGCAPVDAATVRVSSGAADTTLYEAVVAEYSQPVDDPPDKVGELWFDSERTKKTRKVSEIWYAAGFENESRKLADALKDKLGPVEPKAWKWGGPYDIYLIVGAHKVGQAPMTVKVLDGHCITGKKDCKNPLLKKVLDALPKTARVSEKGKAKKARASTQVWYQAGKQALAQSLATGALKAWVAPADVKEWTWGGKFDVLIVVGPPL